MRTFLAIATLLAGVYAAHAFGLGEGNRFGRLGAFTHKGSGGGGGGTNFILLVDGSSKLLQIDNASRVCRAGGC